MDQNDIISSLSMSSSPDISFVETLINFLLCVGMSFVVRAFYIRYSVSLTGKHHVGVVIPLLSSIVFLVIMVVKSSLALSLGLVGALSIVRFRTPIKEPEELVYLFLAIAIGLGYAAGHTLLTTTLATSILIIIYFWLSNKSLGNSSEYNLIINWVDKEVTFNDFYIALEGSLEHLKLVRLDQGPTNNTAVLVTVPEEGVSVDLIASKIRSCDPNAEISFYESKKNW